MKKNVFKALCVFIMVSLLLIQATTAFGATSVVLSGVPSYNQNNTGYPLYYYTCGPTAGANILSYWDSLGYTRLWTPVSPKDSQNGVSLITDLAVHMGSKLGEGTLPVNFSNIIYHTYECGYSFGSYLYEKRKSDGSINLTENQMWEDIKTEINEGRPCALYIGKYPKPVPPGLNPNYNFHWVTIYGYTEDGPQRKIKICTGLNPIGMDSGSRDEIVFSTYYRNVPDLDVACVKPMR